MASKRLFVGIPVTPHFFKPFETFRHLNRHQVNARWVPERNLHVTTFFIGDTAESEVGRVQETIHEIASGFNCFQLQFREFCRWPEGRKARMFWAMFHANESFSSLCHGLEHAITSVIPSGREQLPHITLARFKYMEREKKVHTNVHFDSKVLEVKELILWESVFNDDGVEYEALKDFQLGSRIADGSSSSVPLSA